MLIIFNRHYRMKHWAWFPKALRLHFDENLPRIEAGCRSAVLYSLIGIYRLNGVEPEAWLRYVLGRNQDWPVNRLRDLLPWKAGTPQPERQYALFFRLCLYCRW